MKVERYRNYLLVTLALIYALTFVDRLTLGVVLQDVKNDLNLSDSQLGFLTGIAFALFYFGVGIPISRWADSGNRILIISLSTALWGVAVFICGAVANFGQLLLARTVVAVGEAGCLPSSLSLLSNYFSRHERPRAIALFMQGGTLSLFIGYLISGWLNQFYGWRITFMIVALPGFGLAALAFLTLKEPRLTSIVTQREAQQARWKLREVYAALRPNRTFRHLLLFYVVTSLFNWGIVQWQPAFLIRSFGMKTGELGTWSAAACGFGTMIGLYLGGEWASRGAPNNESLQLRIMAISYSVGGFCSCLIYLSSNRYCAFALMGLWNVAGTMAMGPFFASIQTLVPENMRAVATSVVNLSANLLGLGLGPLLIGTLSDALRPLAGNESLRYSLIALSPGYLWGAWHLWRASKTVTHDLNQVDRGTSEHEQSEHSLSHLKRTRV